MHAELSPQPELLVPLPASITAPQPASYSSAVVDKTEDWGRRRLFAVASVQAAPDRHQVNAETIVSELESTFFASTFTTAEAALERAIDAILQRAATESDSPTDDWSFGCAVGVLEGDRLLIALKAPCQALMRQDDQVYFLSLNGPSPAAPSSGTIDNPDVALFETMLSPGDQFGLLAAIDSGAVRDLLGEPFDADMLERAAGSEGSYVWMEVADDEPVATVSAQPSVPERAGPVPVSEMTPLTTVWEAQSSRSAGLFQRPPGADALRKYRHHASHGVPSSLRARMPRGVPSTRSLVLVAVVFAMIISAGVVAASRRPTPNYPLGATVADYTIALSNAVDTGDQDQLKALLPGARSLLESGGGPTASRADLATLRTQILLAGDFLNGTVRLTAPERVGQIPEDMQQSRPRLIEAGGQLYLQAESLFAVNPASRQLIPVAALSAGTTGVILNGAGNATTLAVSTEDSILFDSDETSGLLEISARWPREFEVEHAHAAAYRDRFYLLDPELGEIVVIDSASREVYRWLLDGVDRLPEESVGMVVDGGIQVLYKGGELFSLSDGIVGKISALTLEPELRNPLAMTLGEESNLIYVADLGSPEGRLIRYDRQNEEYEQFLLGPDNRGRLDSSAHQAFASLTCLLVSEKTGTVYWIADGAIWQARFAGEMPDAGQEI